VRANRDFSRWPEGHGEKSALTLPQPVLVFERRFVEQKWGGSGVSRFPNLIVEKVFPCVLGRTVAITLRQPFKEVVEGLGKLKECSSDFRPLVLDPSQAHFVAVHRIDNPIPILVVLRGKVLHPILEPQPGSALYLRKLGEPFKLSINAVHPGLMNRHSLFHFLQRHEFNVTTIVGEALWNSSNASL